VQAEDAFKVDGSDVGNVVDGVSAGAVNSDFVGDKVEVASTVRWLVGVSPETPAQELNSKRINRTSVIFFIILFS
jgi:hypothetical protein